MAQPVIIDTDILIDFGLDKPDAVQTMVNIEQYYTISVSVITAMELYSGCRSKKDLKEVEELIIPDKLTPHSGETDPPLDLDRKSTRLNSSHVAISYAVFC